MPSRLKDHERAHSYVTLSEEQFAKLVELLTPGYLLAKAYLAEEAGSPDVKKRDVGRDNRLVDSDG